MSSWNKRTTLRARSKNSVMSVAFSADDSFVSVGHFDGTINIFDVHSTAKIHDMTALHLLKNIMDDKHRERQREQKKKQKDHEGGNDDSTLGGSSSPHHSFEDLESTLNREKLPVTCMAFRPFQYKTTTDEKEGEGKSLSSVRPILLFCTSNGYLALLDANTGELVFADKEDNDNEIYCCGWSTTGQHFATAGRDAYVRIYEFKPTVGAQCVKRFTIQNPGSGSPPMRIYSLAWHPFNPHLIYAGGWSQTVTVFDIVQNREGLIEGPSRHDLFGPILTGDAMALIPRHDHSHKNGSDSTSTSIDKSPTSTSVNIDIFTASHRMDDRLELFDAGSMEKTASIPWPKKGQQEFLPLCVDASADGTAIAFGGGGGANFHDGAFILPTPSSKARREAAMAVSEIKRQMQEGKGSNNSSEDNHQHYKEMLEAAQIKFKTGASETALEIFQPTHPVTAIRFSHSSKLVVFGDSDGLVHLYERSK